MLKHNKMVIPDIDSPFKDLEEFIADHIRQRNIPLFEQIITKPIITGTISSLGKIGWTLEYNAFSIYAGYISEERKAIVLAEDLDFKLEDKVLCHEIVHAFYGDISNDNCPYKEDYLPFHLKRNRNIVEWYARKIRANPVLLAEIWKTFNIKPRFYDQASLIATKKLITPQLIFPSFEKDYDFSLID